MINVKTIKEVLKDSIIDRFETQILLAYTLNKNRSYIHAHIDETLTYQQYQMIIELIKRRKSGEPISYLTGKREFWSLEFDVTSAVLIPRHDTELLVETVLETLPHDKNMKLLELGTGCGAIAISLAKDCPSWEITATDISNDALNLAKRNAEKHHTRNVQFVQSDWYSLVKEKKFHAIVSNPPYIAENDQHLASGDLRFEPSAALVSGREGLDAIREIIANAKNHLLSNGWVFLEHGFEQAQTIQHLFKKNGFSSIITRKDLNHHPRVTYAQIIKINAID